MSAGRERWRRSRRWPPRTLARVLTLFVRILAVILTVQTSGVAHGAVDLAAAALGQTVEHEDCTADGDEDKCPPGCPSCHCSHGAASLIPPGAVDVHVPHPADGISWSQRRATQTPPAPLLSTVYRPPKVIASLS